MNFIACSKFVFIITFGVAFGLQAHQAQLSTEVTEMKSMVSDLAKKVDAIQKELEE